MTMVNKDSQSAIEQKRKSALHSLLLWCVPSLFQYI